MKDTLTLYEELVATGISDAQAKIQAHQMGAMGDHLGNAINGLNTRLDKIEMDMFWMRIIGGAMTVAFFSNGFFMWLAK